VFLIFLHKNTQGWSPGPAREKKEKTSEKTGKEARKGELNKQKG